MNSTRINATVRKPTKITTKNDKYSQNDSSYTTKQVGSLWELFGTEELKNQRKHRITCVKKQRQAIHEVNYINETDKLTTEQETGMEIEPYWMKLIL